MTHLVWKLFSTFLKVGFFSFGGGYVIIPLIQEEIVERHGWITMRTLTDIISISQTTPGPIVINAATFVGYAVADFPGALAATVGSALPGVCMAFLLNTFFTNFKNSQYAMAVLDGLKSASIGLIASAAGGILVMTVCGIPATVCIHINITASCMFVASLIALRMRQISPVVLLMLCAAIGIVFL